MKKALIVVLVLLVLGALIGGFFIYRHASSTIGKKAAVEIALKDAGVERTNAMTSILILSTAGMK